MIIAYLIWKGSYNTSDRHIFFKYIIAYLIWKGSYNLGVKIEKAINIIAYLIWKGSYNKKYWRKRLPTMGAGRCSGYFPRVLQTLCGWGGREDYLQQDISFVEAGRGCTGHFGDSNAGNCSVPCAASGVLPYSDREGYRFPETACTESEVHFPGQSHSQPGYIFSY